jgi:hypothetical protein
MMIFIFHSSSWGKSRDPPPRAAADFARTDLRLPPPPPIQARAAANRASTKASRSPAYATADRRVNTTTVGNPTGANRAHAAIVLVSGGSPQSLTENTTPDPGSTAAAASSKIDENSSHAAQSPETKATTTTREDPPLPRGDGGKRVVGQCQHKFGV